MDFPYGETVTRVRAQDVLDPYSGETIDKEWPDLDESGDIPGVVDVEGCAVWQGSSTEPILDARDMVVSDYTVAAPAGADIVAGDRVLIRGLLCDVAGRPFDWRSPFTGWAPGLIVQANLVEG
jgi:hypothetical protein